MLSHLGREFVHLVFFKALPGRAVAVQSELADRCITRGMTAGEDYRAFRMIGGNDIVYVEKGDSMTHSRVAELGVLPSVIGSSEHLCYCLNGSVLAPLASIGPLFGLSFVKLSHNYVVREGLAGTYSAMRSLKTKSMRSDMGSVGWADFVSIFYGSDMMTLLDDLFGIAINGQREFRCDSRPYNTADVIAKTVSFLAYDPTWLTSAGAENSSGNVSCEIEFACPPIAMADLEASLIEVFGDGVSMSLGARDLSCRIDVASAGDLASSLGKYEAYMGEHAGQLLDGRVRILRSPVVGAPSARPFRTGQNMLELRGDEALEIGRVCSEGRALVRALYLYNNMLADPLLYGALSDMMGFAVRLRQLGMALIGAGTPRLSRRRSIAITLHYMQQGVVQRSQGAFGALEQNAGDVSFGAVTVGYPIQKVIKAIEYYPRACLAAMKKEWAGFVLVGRQISPIIEHFEDIILVPSHDALAATRHWAIMHEIMHVYQNLSAGAEMGGREASVWDEGIRHVPGAARHLLVEAYADVMTYFLTCPLGLKEYFSVVWRYLIAELYEGEAGQWQMQSYVLRNLAVMMVEKYMAGKLDMQSARQEDALSAVLDELVLILAGVDVRLAAALENDESLRAEVLEGGRVFVAPRLAGMSVWLQEHGLFRDDGLVVGRARDAVESLRRGEVLSGAVMERPELVAWCLAGEQDDVRVTIAWLMSLYNAYIGKHEPIDRCAWKGEIADG